MWPIVPHITLALLILWKELVLVYYHRVMPVTARVAVSIPGIGLAVIYILFQFYGSYIPEEIRVSVLSWSLVIFFIWNGLFAFFTRDQHRKV